MYYTFTFTNKSGHIEHCSTTGSNFMDNPSSQI